MIYIVYRMIDGLTWLMMFLVTIAVNPQWVTKLQVNIIGEAQVIKHSLFTTSHISAIALHGGSVDKGIVTSRKHILWRHDDRLSLQRFYFGHVRLIAVQKLRITRYISG